MLENNNIEYAGFWIRVWASIIDTIIVLAFTIPITFMIYGEKLWTNESLLMGYADLFINWIAPAIIVILFWLYKSATPAKMILHLKVVDADTGQVLSIKQALIRYVSYFLAIIPLFLGFIWVGFDTRKQGWHDKLANSVVIKTRK